MKSSYSYLDAPRWCPNAIPTNRGWCHPVTGELLVSIPGGIPVVEREVLTEVVSKPVLDERVQETILIDETVQSGEVLKDEVKPVITETKKQPRPRKKKEA